MNRFLLVLVCVGTLLLLGVRFFFFFSHQKEYTDGQKVSIETTLFLSPRIDGKSQRFSASDSHSPSSLHVITSRFPSYHFGDTLRITGSVKKRVTEKKQTFYTIYFPSIEPSARKNLLSVLSPFRNRIIEVFDHALTPDSSALLLGVVFGVKAQMSERLLRAFQETGLLHVIAASGMNIAMVGGFFSRLFSSILHRRVALVLTIVSILFYAILAGLEPSIMRASIMGSIVFSAQILGRQTLAWYSLLIAGFTMLFVSPFLLMDIGFQLSFLATLGLIYIPPLFERGIFKNYFKSFIGEGFVTTFSAQLSTLPILLVNFGSYNPLSILVNSLVLWTVPYVMMIGGVAAVFSLLFEQAARLLLFLSYPLLWYIQNTALFFDGLDQNITFLTIPTPLIIGYYLLLVSGVLLFYKPRARD